MDGTRICGLKNDKYVPQARYNQLVCNIIGDTYYAIFFSYDTLG